MTLPLMRNVTAPDGGTTLTTAVSTAVSPTLNPGGSDRNILTPVWVTWTESGALVQLAPHVVLAAGVPALAGV